MISPSSAFSNWLRGTSTFLLTPEDVGELQPQEVHAEALGESSSTSSFPAPAQVGGKAFQARPVAVDRRPRLGRRHMGSYPATEG